MSKPFLSVILPTFNNARTLPLTLIDIDHHLAQANMSGEIIVVDDASTDASAEIARRFRMLLGNIRLFSSPHRKGLGAAVHEGLRAANGKWRVVLYPTNAASIVEFHKVFPYLQRGVDVAVGSRVIMRARIRPLLRVRDGLFRMLHNFLMQAILIPGVRDTESGWYCFSEAAAKRVSECAKIDSAGWVAEAIALARKMGFRVKEFPIFWSNHTPKRFDYQHYIEALIDAVRVRWMLFRNMYQLK